MAAQVVVNAYQHIRFDNTNTTLQFTTIDEIPTSQELAFMVEDVQGKAYVIGQKETPYPMVEIDTKVDSKENVKVIKVVFVSKKSLIPITF